MAEATPGGGSERNSSEVSKVRERIMLVVGSGRITNADQFFTDAAFIQEVISRPRPKQSSWFSRKSNSDYEDEEFGEYLKVAGKEDYIHDKLWEYLGDAKGEGSSSDVKKGLKAFQALGYDRVFGSDIRSYDRFFDDLIKLEKGKLFDESAELERSYKSIGEDLRKTDPGLRREYVSRIKAHDALDESEKVLEYVYIAARLGYMFDSTGQKTVIGKNVETLRAYHTDLLNQRRQRQGQSGQFGEEAWRAANEQRQRDEQARQRANTTREYTNTGRRQQRTGAESAGAANQQSGQDVPDESWKNDPDPIRRERRRLAAEKKAERAREQRARKAEVSQYINNQWSIAERASNLSNTSDLASSIQRYQVGALILKMWILKDPDKVTPDTVSWATEALISKIWLNMPVEQVKQYLREPTTDAGFINAVKMQLARVLFVPENHPNPAQASRLISTKLKGVHPDKVNQSDRRLVSLISEMKKTFDDARVLLSL